MPNNVEKMSFNYSLNFDLKKRDNKKIKYLIYHYTGMRSDRSAIKKLTNHNSKASSHYYITKMGKLIQLVPDLYSAWHSGKSNWKSDKSLNKNSIGIEISNSGHDHGYENFNKKQINCLIKISKILIKKYKIKKQNVLGHSDIAPLRKKDPGEKFPWKFLADNKIGVWYKIRKKKLKNLRGNNFDLNISFFLNKLKKFGYCTNYSNLNELKKIIKSFQRRFRPELIDGKLDRECFEIIKSLI
jgi:N-acetylmuramoyl-L-alanine amidase